MTLADGVPLSPALGIGAFSELTLVDAGQAVKVNSQARPEAAGLVGCGIMAGLGAAINTGGVTRGDSVAVIGCGGVGDAAIAGSRLAGAHTIIAVDVDDRKLEWAREFGATHTINSARTDPVEAIRQLTGQASGRQVKNAKLGLVSGFGMINYDRGLGSGAAILQKTG
jgi:S-(hydroxymethyl)mycothiol dehydrogenase